MVVVILVFSCGVVIVGSLSARPPFGATFRTPLVPGVPVLVEAMVSLQQPDSTPHQGVGGELAVGSGPVHPWKPEYAKQDIEEFRKRR